NYINTIPKGIIIITSINLIVYIITVLLNSFFSMIVLNIWVPTQHMMQDLMSIKFSLRCLHMN
ncbi:MAG: hypothetical protein ACK5D5_05665, partial [Bacteroidota bacterium]